MVKDELPQKEMTTTEAIQTLKDLFIQCPLLDITDLGRAIKHGIKALEGER